MSPVENCVIWRRELALLSYSCTALWLRPFLSDWSPQISRATFACLFRICAWPGPTLHCDRQQLESSNYSIARVLSRLIS